MCLYEQAKMPSLIGRLDDMWQIIITTWCICQSRHHKHEQYTFLLDGNSTIQKVRHYKDLNI